jgi:hypothetical protein
LQNRPEQQRKPKPLGNLQAFFDSLKPAFVKPRWKTSYTPLDRYREFNEVFRTEAGRRVLAQIVDLCEGIPLSLNQIENHAYMAFRQGQREVGLKITQYMVDEPTDYSQMNEDEND